MNGKSNAALIYFAVAIFAALFFQGLLNDAQVAEQIPYSQFEQALADGGVADLVIGAEDISGAWVTPHDGRTRFITQRVDPALADALRGAGATYAAAPSHTWLTAILSWTLPALMFFGLWFLVMRRMGGGGGIGALGVGRSKAKIYVETEMKVTFADVAGVDEAKEELRELVEFLKNPAGHGGLGARAPKGVLLLGPPGTGKTLLARAVAGEAGVPFFSISGSEFVEMFVGVGAARVRDLFDQARKRAPAIIFIDELDALGRARGMAGMVGGNDEREQTLNQLLSEIDGFDSSVGVVLLAATNRPEILDPALLRAGRFDRQVLIDRPDKAGRAAILAVHVKKISLARAVSIEEIAALTTGFTGADLANLVNEAALMATRRNADAVEAADFTSAIERIVAGLEKRKRLMNPREREIVAVHETGHALAALALSGTERVHKISIIPRGVGALGYTIQRPTEDRYLMTRQELETKIVVLMAGRAAEHLVFGHLSTGAADDLAKATDIARSMATRYGMDAGLGHVAYDRDAPNLLGVPDAQGAGHARPSDATVQRIDAAVSATLDAAFARARAVLDANRGALTAISDALLRKETLDEAELGALAGDLAQPVA
jgi:cell division protease FtsH